ncbi:hypothetical protein Psfp_00394 [Pelotomaculum sp. FP]|nr:hypothetical protein Psfp_00394 [Pelotomaculum sp. FP]
MDLENKTFFEHIKAFAQKMRVMREHLAQAGKLYYKYQKERWFLDAVEIYCEAVNCLLNDLTLADLKSRGFLAFREYITNYESFAATNEREGSEIARQIICALLEKRIKVFFVTHLYDFARSFYDKQTDNAIFLRAEIQSTPNSLANLRTSSLVSLANHHQHPS